MSDIKNVPERLLDVAEKLFCENGFDQTSVRDIVRDADCNIAAINYHFGGKDKLYFEMFRRHFEKIVVEQTANIKQVMESQNPTLEKLLDKIVRYALKSLQPGSQDKPLLKMLVREMLNPHLKGKILSDGMFSELQNYFNQSVCCLVNGLSQRDMLFCMFSVDGLLVHCLLFYEHYKAALQDITFDELVKHIVDFACSGIKNKAKGEIE